MFRAMSLIVVAALLEGCFGAPPPPPPPQPLPPTRVVLNVEAANDVNPGPGGQGAPVLLRIYELKGASVFNSADFFALYNKDQAVLGADLMAKREFLLRPGEKQTLNFDAADGAMYLGTYAAFRDLDSARWRVSDNLVLHGVNIFDLKLSGMQMSLTRAPQNLPNPQVLPERRQ